MHRTSRPLLLVVMMLFLGQTGLQNALAGMDTFSGDGSGDNRLVDGHADPAVTMKHMGHNPKEQPHAGHRCRGDHCPDYQCSSCVAELVSVSDHPAGVVTAPDPLYTNRWLTSRFSFSVFRPPKA